MANGKWRIANVLMLLIIGILIFGPGTARGQEPPDTGATTSPAVSDTTATVDGLVQQVVTAVKHPGFAPWYMAPLLIGAFGNFIRRWRGGQVADWVAIGGATGPWTVKAALFGRLAWKYFVGKDTLHWTAISLTASIGGLAFIGGLLGRDMSHLSAVGIVIALGVGYAGDTINQFRKLLTL